MLISIKVFLIRSQYECIISSQTLYESHTNLLIAMHYLSVYADLSLDDLKRKMSKYVLVADELWRVDGEEIAENKKTKLLRVYY